MNKCYTNNDLFCLLEEVEEHKLGYTSCLVSGILTLILT